MKFRELAFVAVLPGGGENKRRCSSGPLGLGVPIRVTFASSHGMLPDSYIFQPPVTTGLKPSLLHSSLRSTGRRAGQKSGTLASDRTFLDVV